MNFSYVEKEYREELILGLKSEFIKCKGDIEEAEEVLKDLSVEFGVFIANKRIGFDEKYGTLEEKVEKYENDKNQFNEKIDYLNRKLKELIEALNEYGIGWNGSRFI